MKRPLVALASVLLSILADGSSLPSRVWARQVTPTAGDDQKARLIAALNDCLQERFRDVDERFGIRRIINTRETPHRFKPENVRELATIQEIERERLRLVLYLTGRRVLRAKVDTSNVNLGSLWALVKGPVLVTPVDPMRAAAADVTADTPPQPVELLEKSRRAMAAFAHVESYDFVIGRWKFVAHPVRASDTMCLNCHREEHTTLTSTQNASGTPLRVGDPLGVVLYGYQTVK